MKKERAKKMVWGMLLSLVLLSGCGVIKMVDTPFADDDCVGKNVQEIVDTLESAGFTNIELKAKETSMEERENDVIEVTINGALFWEGDAKAAGSKVVIEYYELSEEAKQIKEEERNNPKSLRVKMDIAVEGEQGKPEFSISTNLPDGTVLDVELSGRENSDFEYFEYFEQREITVQNGEAKTGVFTKDGEPLIGTYSFGVTMLPEKQTEQIQEIIGQTGENIIQGDLVEKYDDYRYIVASCDYINIPYEMVIDALRKNMAISFGGDYELYYTDERIVMKAWKSGIANNVALAKMGVQGCIDVWDNLVETIQRNCIDIERNLKAYGHDNVALTIVVLNDLNRENNLLIVTSGYVVYDYVNGIDLISILAG